MATILPLTQQHHGSSPAFWLWHSCFNSCNCNAATSSPGKANTQALQTSCHNLVLDLGQPQHGLCVSGGADTHTESTLDLCKHTSPTCFNAPFLWGKGQGPNVGRRENTLKRNRTCPTFKATIPAPSEQTLLLIGGWSHWAERKSYLTPRAGFSSFSISHTPYQGDSDQHTWGRMWLAFT